MKKLIAIIATITVLLSACSNDFVLNAPAKDIPVIYGFLSRADTAQYIRVEKAFIDNNTNAELLAGESKNLYFENINVELYDVDAKKTYQLNRVDGNLEGYVRNPGKFGTTPNYLYKIKTSNIDLKENKSFRIIVKKSDASILAQAECVITPDMKLNEDRTPPSGLSVATSKFTISFLQSNVNTAKMYDIILHYNIDERNVAGGPWEPKRLSYTLTKGFVPGITEKQELAKLVNYSHKGDDFYNFLANNLDKNAPVVRRLNTLDVEIWSGGVEMYDYINFGNINSGITGTEVIPSKTNLKDANGNDCVECRGILSSRNRYVYSGISIAANSLDSLRKGRFTKNLNFQ